MTDFNRASACLATLAIELFETGGDRYEAQREQWDDGNNVLALAPGVVVAYERNVTTNTHLRRNGIEVVYAQSTAVPMTQVAVEFDAGVAADPADALGTQREDLRDDGPVVVLAFVLAAAVPHAPHRFAQVAAPLLHRRAGCRDPAAA